MSNDDSDGSKQTCIIWEHDQTLVNSLHGLLKFGICGLECCVIATEYISRVHCTHMPHGFFIIHWSM